MLNRFEESNLFFHLRNPKFLSLRTDPMSGPLRYFLLLIIWGALLANDLSECHANGLTISNLSRDSLNQTVSFDIEWNNSWRLDGLSSPFNWDAAWVFVKFLPCNASPTTPWLHGAIDPVIANHSFGSALEPVLSDGMGPGIDTDAKGVLLRRTATGLFGNAGPSRISLHVTNMGINTAYHMRVIGVEMVYVPQGAYELGGVTYSNAFSLNNTSNDPTPVTISSENAQTILSHASGANASVTLDAAFPKGYGAFHIMKYEITQGQYATFLNSISLATQYTRYPGNQGSNRNQLGITGSNPLATFGSTRPDRAQNFISWSDVAAYLDWAALRPISELEFEKACRGLNTAIQDEYPWGSTNIFELTAMTSPEDGAEIPAVLPANANYISNNFSSGDGGRGPVRAGIFALPSNSTREQSGAGYYGIMELGGNVSEACVAVDNTTAQGGTVNFTGTWGDGDLDVNGEANTIGWPSVSSGGFIHRGGGWDNNQSSLRVADRSRLSLNGGRARETGGRGGR